MDLHGNGWMDSPDLWDEMRGLDRLDRMLLARKAPFAPEVAAIADERSLLAVARGTATGRCMGAARKSLARAGAVDDVPQAPDRMKVAVADGARLVLDFPGVKKVWSLRLGGRKIPTGIVGANDYPEYLGGIGRLEIEPGGSLLLIR